MTASDPVFVDTNVLIYAKLAESPFHVKARDTLRNLHQGGTDLWVSRQVLREYLSAMTRPNTLTAAISVNDLVNDVKVFRTQFQIAEDSSQTTTHLLDLVTTVRVAGKQIHDANIVATMLAHNLTHLITQNVGDFRRYSQLITVIPLAPSTE